MENTLWILQLPFPVTLDTPDLDPVQGLARLQEPGINEHQVVIKIRKVMN